METVLSIAGSDPSAGAGIQQDIKTITSMGCYGATVITALTSQNTMGVSGVTAVQGEVVRSQLISVLDDLKVSAIKIGQIPTLEVAETIVNILSTHKAAKVVPVVYDPVMISTSGHRLMEPDCMDYIKYKLFERCTLVTPNLPEAETLLGGKLSSISAIEKGGRELSSRYRTAFLLKGGHAEVEEMVDRLFYADGTAFGFYGKRIRSSNLHGTGCTLSSAIASGLALGLDLKEAVSRGKDVVRDAIIRGRDIQVGHGNGPLWLFDR